MRSHETPPSDERTEEILKYFNNGDWISDPWYLKKGGAEPFSDEEAREATRILERVYPADVCRQMLSQGHGVLILALFNPFIPGLIYSILQLGLDLRMTGGFEDKKLIARLRNRDEYNGAAFEQWACATLLRSGYRVFPETPGPGRTNADFSVYVGGIRYVIEIKMIQRNEMDDLAQETESAFHMLSDFTVPHHLTRILPSACLDERCRSKEGRQSVKKQLPELLEAFRQALTTLQESGLGSGVYPVDPHGSIQIEAAAQYPRGAFECNLIPTQSDHRMASKIAKHIQEGAQQLPSNCTGAVLVDMGMFNKLDIVRKEVLAKRSQHSGKFRNCDLVLLRATGPDDTGRIRSYVYTWSFRRQGPTAQDRMLADALQAPFVSERYRPSPRSRLIRGPKAELKEGGSVTFSTNMMTGETFVIEPEPVGTSHARSIESGNCNLLPTSESVNPGSEPQDDGGKTRG